jgi:hypothetical protein
MRSSYFKKDVWEKACLFKLSDIVERNPNIVLTAKFFDLGDGEIECMLMNHANEAIATIGEWSELEEGEVYEL